MANLIILGIFIFPILKWGNEFYLEFILAGLLSTINAFIGYYIVIFSAKLNNVGFNKNVYGGMIIRFIILINTIMYLNHIELIFIVPFFISMLIFYLSYH